MCGQRPQAYRTVILNKKVNFALPIIIRLIYLSWSYYTCSPQITRKTKGGENLTIIYTILIFGLIIFVHELGHFVVAKLSKVTVKEFSLGMGPAILKFRPKETLYALRLFPIGGYVAMEGEDEDSPDDNAFNKKSVPKRIAICIAGATMNLLLGFAIIGMTLIGSDSFGTTTVAKFNENATTSESGLMEGDKILKANNSPIFIDKDIIFEVVRDDNGIMDIQVLREGEKVLLSDVKFKVSGEGQQKQIDFDFKVTSKKMTIFSGIERAFKETVSLARNSWVSVGDLFTGKVKFTELSGPVGVGQVVGEAAKMGISSLASIAAFISISIGMFNLLPFPALDGGRVIFLLIEAIRRKPIPTKYEAYINGVGMILLFGLMIVITLKDVMNLF